LKNLSQTVLKDSYQLNFFKWSAKIAFFLPIKTADLKKICDICVLKFNTIMGKGDKRTAKGKRIAKSYGNSRPTAKKLLRKKRIEKAEEKEG